MSNKTMPNKTISYSQYSLWSNCPLAWKLKYVDGHYDDESSIDLIFGTAMHNTLERFVTELFKDEKHAVTIAYDEILLDNMKSEFLKTVKKNDAGEKTYICTKEQLQEYYEDGRQIINYMLKHRKEFFPTKKHKLIGIELKLKLNVLPEVDFVAFLDVVIFNELTQTYKIIDFKTSKSGWTFQKKDPIKINQLLLYKKFYAQIFNIPEKDIIPEFIILKRKIPENTLYEISRISRFVPAHGTPSIKKAVSSWNYFLKACYSSSGDRIASNVVPTPSLSNCRFCQFKLNKELCPVGHYKK